MWTDQIRMSVVGKGVYCCGILQTHAGSTLLVAVEYGSWCHQLGGALRYNIVSLNLLMAPWWHWARDVTDRNRTVSVAMAGQGPKQCWIFTRHLAETNFYVSYRLWFILVFVLSFQPVVNLGRLTSCKCFVAKRASRSPITQLDKNCVNEW